MTPDRLRLLALAVLGVIVLSAGAVWAANVTAAPSAGQQAGAIARAYAERTTVWNSGPSVKSVSIMPLSRLRPALRNTVTSQIADDVDITDLKRRVGPRRRVALVVLHGVFNTLPPDEGVTITGDMVAIVDMQGRRVLLLTD